MCVGGFGLSIIRCAQRSMSRISRGWSFRPVPTIPTTKERNAPVSCQSSPLVILPQDQVFSQSDASSISGSPSRVTLPDLPSQIMTKLDSTVLPPVMRGYSEHDEITPPDSAAAITVLPTRDGSAAGSSVVTDQPSNRLRQAHLVKLHPHLAVLADRPCNGKRVKLIMMLSCDKLWHHGCAVRPLGNSGVETSMRGKHRGNYTARRDFHKCLHYDCFELGIELVMDAVNIRECRDHLQKRLLSGSSSMADPINQRASSKARALVVTDDVQEKVLETPELTLSLRLSAFVRIDIILIVV